MKKIKLFILIYAYKVTIYNPLIWDKERACYKRWVCRLIDLCIRLRWKPLYYYHFSRDCDMYEQEYCGIYERGKKNFNKMVEHWYEHSCEGAACWEIITKEQYDLWLEETGGRTRHRDRVMEAYENGRGNSIYV